MKKIFLKIAYLALTTLFLSNCIISSKSNMDFAKQVKFAEDAEIVSINIPTILVKSTLVNAVKSDKNLEKDSKKELIALIAKIKSFKLMTVDNNAEIDQKLFDNLTRYSNKKNFEEMISIVDGKDQIKIYTQKNKKTQRLLLSIISEKKEAVFIDIKCNITDEEIAKVVSFMSTNTKKIKR
jgi:hypothetical protein